MRDIAVFGGSLTWGAWDSEKGGWVNRLRLFIDETDEDAFVYNLSIPGQTTADLLQRFMTEALAREPELIIISIGGNDLTFIGSVGKNNIGPDEFSTNIDILLKQAREITPNVIVVGLINLDENRTNPVEWETDLFYSNENVELYNELWTVACSNNEVPFIDTYGLLEINDYEDGLRPNAKGHKKIFERVKDYMIENNYL